MRDASVLTAASTTAGSFSWSMAIPDASFAPSASAPARADAMYLHPRHDLVNDVLKGVRPLTPSLAAASAASSPSAPP